MSWKHVVCWFAKVSWTAGVPRVWHQCFTGHSFGLHISAHSRFLVAQGYTPSEVILIKYPVHSHYDIEYIKALVVDKGNLKQPK